jgi:hypothetical protein
MCPRSVSPPDADEFAPFFATYIDLVRDRDPLGVLGRQVPALRRACAGMGEQEALHRYGPGKWSVKEVVGHLSDTERVLSYRLLRISRGDGTPLSAFDENAYVVAAGFDRRELSALVDDLESVRMATLHLLDGVGPEALHGWGVVSGRPMTARALLYIIAGHVEHHFRILGERYGVNVPSAHPT